jgi:hypothetical protein
MDIAFPFRNKHHCLFLHGYCMPLGNILHAIGTYIACHWEINTAVNSFMDIALPLRNQLRPSTEWKGSPNNNNNKKLTYSEIQGWATLENHPMIHAFTRGSSPSLFTVRSSLNNTSMVQGSLVRGFLKITHRGPFYWPFCVLTPWITKDYVNI